MFGLNEGLNQSTGIEFPIRMLLGILELVWLNRVSEMLCFV